MLSLGCLLTLWCSIDFLAFFWKGASRNTGVFSASLAINVTNGIDPSPSLASERTLHRGVIDAI
jgi:hypothetical protein